MLYVNLNQPGFPFDVICQIFRFSRKYVSNSYVAN